MVRAESVVGAEAQLNCLPVARHLVLIRPKSDLSLSKLIFEEREFLLLLVELVEKAPWKHDGRKFDGRFWVPASEKVCVSEGNVWLCIWSMVLSEEVHTGQYDVSASHRANSLLSLRRHLTVNLLEQIPPLSDLQRFLEELNLTHELNSKKPLTASWQGSLVMVQEKSLYEACKDIAFRPSCIANKACLMDVCKAWDGVYESLGFYDDPVAADDEFIAPKKPEKMCVTCKALGALNRCSQCKQAVYCCENCQLMDWPKHRQICTTQKKQLLCYSKESLYTVEALSLGIGHGVSGASPLNRLNWVRADSIDASMSNRLLPLAP